jgi:hypothetical protein
MTEVYGVFFTDNHADYIEAAFDTEDEAVSYMRWAEEKREGEEAPEGGWPPYFVDAIARGDVDFDQLNRGFAQTVWAVKRW